MTDAQLKALLTMVEYTARMVVRVSEDTKAIRRKQTEDRHNYAAQLRRLRDANINLKAEVMGLKIQLAEFQKFNDI